MKIIVNRKPYNCFVSLKKLLFIWIVLLATVASAQQDAWVYFNDKPNSSDYLSNPLTMLTQRSLDRRASQNISLDLQDVPVYQSYIDQVEAAAGITVYAKSKWLNAVHVRGTQSQVNALSAFGFVDHVEFADALLNVAGKLILLKPLAQVNKTVETTANFNYGNSLNQIAMLHGEELHQQDYTGTGKIIAVMDGGFPDVNSAAIFQRLRDNNQILGGYDFVNRDLNFYTGISHGTSVLSTMGGYADGQLIGTAPDAAYYLFITEDGNNESPLEESLWVEAAEEADRLGVDIITTSLGYSQFDNPDYNHSYQDMNGITTFISRGLDIAYSRGMICVVAAGNEGASNWHYITAPADAINALTVGAVNASETPANFSSYGPSYDGRVKPDVAAKGQGASIYSVGSGTVSTTGNGTSFACPILAGMVASFWQAVPNKTNNEIMQLIKESASIYNNPNDRIGYGIPNFAAALENALGLYSFLDQPAFAVYPNPTHDAVSITVPGVVGSIILYNTTGQKVFEQKLSARNSSIWVDQLETGLYLYKIQSNGATQNGKLIKY